MTRFLDLLSKKFEEEILKKTTWGQQSILQKFQKAKAEAAVEHLEELERSLNNGN